MKAFSEHSERVRAMPALAHDGLFAGARVLTMEGALPVEYLSPGDRIISRTAGMVRLLDIERMESRAAAYRIDAGGLSGDWPERSVTMPGRTRINLRGALAAALGQHGPTPVERLCDGRCVRPAPRRARQMLRLRFEVPQILYVDGLEILCASVAALQRA